MLLGDFMAYNELHIHTSFRVIGFSNRIKCVKCVRFFRGSISASSERLFAVRTRVCRLGIDCPKVDWM